MIGTKLAHYEITSHLGSGGMGEVYQATDSKLGRSVAIKFLPEAFGHDNDRVMRFQHEARVLASLNHSNIAAIHGIEESAGRKFLVMELVSGETLAERIKRGPIPIDEALHFATQIAEALEAAHENGVIHRDLKPANIKITPQGQVKVLDFGLAKAFAGEAAEVNLSNSPTLSMAATNAGVILGTAAYMSPEQAKGRTVDKRTDIFAFGCVLYEMLTGRAVFEGEDVTDILGAVLKSEPDWTRLPAETPLGIRKLLRRCVEKNVKNRRNSAADVRIDIEEALAEPVTPLKKTRERLAWGLVVAMLAVSTTLAIPAYRYFTPAESAVIQFDFPLPPGTSLQPGRLSAPGPTVSPDGRYVSFAAVLDDVPRLWVRPSDSLDAQMIPGTEGAVTGGFWSPDSRHIGFIADGKLKTVTADGGSPPQELVEVGIGIANSGTWNSEDVIVFESQEGLYRVPVGGGASTRLLSPDKSHGETNLLMPYFLPNGKDFLFVANNSDPARTAIRVASIDGGEAKSILQVKSRAAYASGHLFFVRDGTLMAQPFDVKRLTLSGEPKAVAQSVANIEVIPDAAFGVSDSGVLVYKGGAGTSLKFTWFERNGKPLGVESNETNMVGAELSLDGQRMAFQKRDSRGNVDAWVRDLVRETDTRLTSDSTIEENPVWSPDGSSIVFNRRGNSELYRKSSNGTGSEVRLLAPAGSVATDWSRDGRYIVYTLNNNDVWCLPMAGEEKPYPLLASNSTEFRAKFSPAGKFIAYTSNESGRNEIYVQTFPLSGDRWTISVNGGEFASWSADGKELFFSTPDRKIMAVGVKPGSTFETPRVLFEVPSMPVGRFGVTADGQRFLFTLPREDTQIPAITTIVNWPALLKE